MWQSYALHFLLHDVELFSDPDDPNRVTEKTRRLGLVVIRGPQVSLVSPEDGTEEIANPFLGEAETESETILPESH